jgi:hypothetical protein
MQRGAAVRPPSRLADPLSCGTGAVRDPGSTGSGPASAGTQCTPGATFTAEVSLAGSLRPVRGVLSANGHSIPGDGSQAGLYEADLIIGMAVPSNAAVAITRR